MSDVQFRISKDKKRIDILTYFPASYDHDEGLFPVAHIKLSESTSSYMDDFRGDYEELLTLLQNNMNSIRLLARMDAVKQVKNASRVEAETLKRIASENGTKYVNLWELGEPLPLVAQYENVKIISLDYNKYKEKIVRYQVDDGRPRYSMLREDAKGEEYFTVNSRRYPLGIFTYYAEKSLGYERLDVKKWRPKPTKVYARS